MFIFIIAPFSNLIKLNRLDTVPKCRWLKTLSFLGLKMVKMGSKICIFNKVSFFESDQTESIGPSIKMQFSKPFSIFFCLEMVKMGSKICIFNKVSFFEYDQTESIEPSNKMQFKKKHFPSFFWLEMVGVENVYFKVSVFFRIELSKIDLTWCQNAKPCVPFQLRLEL